MNQCELLNATIKRMCNSRSILPPEYQQVEFLESGGSEYIITGQSIISTLETHCDGVFTGKNGEHSTLVGGRNANTFNGRYIVFGAESSTDYLRVVYSGQTEITTCNLFERSSIIFNDREHKAYINGNLVAVFTGYTLLTSGQQNVTLFGMSGYNDANVKYKGIGRLYSVSFYDNTTGDKIGDYIPCYRRSDRKPGMYDIISDNFYTNNGTGEFTLGPEV